MQDKQSQFAEAVKKLLGECELVPADEADRRISLDGIDYIRYVGDYVDSAGEYRDILMPYKSWNDLLDKVNEIFDSKVGNRTTEHELGREIFGSGVFPPSAAFIDQYIVNVFERLLYRSETQAEALVPLYNLRCIGTFELPLASTVLHSGHNDSLLAQRMKQYTAPFVDTLSRDRSFLSIKVTGDTESRLEQIRLESEYALTVLRFISHWHNEWRGNKRVTTNQARFVSVQPSNSQPILFYNSQRGSRWHSSSVIMLDLFEDNLELAKHYGIEDLNHHYQNAERNSISKRVCRALEFYDSGTRAFTNWQTMYRYVASVNVALPTSAHKGDKISEQLRILIQEGGNFIGASDSPAKTWDEIVAETTRPFSDFYRLRNDILHGNEGINSPSDEQVEEARVLAHNTVRLMAKLARQYGWNTYKDAKKWFEARMAKD